MTIPALGMNYDFSKIDWSLANATSNMTVPELFSPVAPSSSAKTNTPKADPKRVNENIVECAKDLLNSIDNSSLTQEKKTLLGELLDEYLSNDAPRLSEKDFNSIKKIALAYLNNPEFEITDDKVKTLTDVATKHVGTKSVVVQQAEAEKKVKKEQQQQEISALAPEYDKDEIIKYSAYSVDYDRNDFRNLACHYDNDTYTQSSRDDICNRADAILTEMENMMLEEALSDADETVKNRVKKARENTFKRLNTSVQEFGFYEVGDQIICAVHEGGTGLFEDAYKYGSIQEKSVIDLFFAEYERLKQKAVDKYKQENEIKD